MRAGRTLGCIGLLGVVIVCLSACDTDRGGELLSPLLFTASSAGDGQASERYGEPNDTIERAIDIPTNDTPIISAFHRAKDVDYYRFLAAKGSDYIIQVGDVESGVKTRLALHTSTDQEIASSVGGSLQPGGSEIRWTASEAGFYYVRVSLIEGGSVGTYKLRIGVGADNYEPDNSLSAARPITVSNVPQQHTLHDRSDEDYVAFAGWAGFTYTITVELTGSPQDITLTVVDASGDSLGSNAAPPHFAATIVAPRDDFYYVRTAAKDDRALGTYNVQVAPASDPREPDSTLALAGPIPVDGTTQRHSFSSPRDQDYVKFEARAGKFYLIRTDSLSDGVDTQIELNSVAGTALISNDDWGSYKGSELSWQGVSAATFYVRVRSTAEGKPGHYVLSVKEQ